MNKEAKGRVKAILDKKCRGILQNYCLGGRYRPTAAVCAECIRHSSIVEEIDLIVTLSAREEGQ